MINEILFPVFLFMAIFCFECCLFYNPQRTAKLTQTPIPTAAPNEICTQVVPHEAAKVPPAEVLQSTSADSATLIHLSGDSVEVKSKPAQKTTRRTTTKRATAATPTTKASTRSRKKTGLGISTAE